MPMISPEMPEDYIPLANGQGRPVYSAESSRIAVQFKREYVYNHQKSIEQGREVLEERIILLKRAHKDTNVISKVATAADKREFAAEWQRFEQGLAQGIGDNLDRLYGISALQVAECFHHKLATIEELAEAAPDIVAQITEGERLQAAAKVWVKSRGLEAQEASAIVVVEAYKKRNEELERELEELRAKVEQQPSKPRGRPRKVKGDSDEKA